MTSLRLTPFFVVLGFAALGPACGPSPDVEVKMVRSADELQQKRDAGAFVVHALSKDNYDKGHVPGATNVAHDQVSAETLPPDKSRPVVFYCAGKGCPVSAMAANRAVKAGYTDVWIYEDGLDGWKRAGQPLSTGPNP